MFRIRFLQKIIHKKEYFVNELLIHENGSFLF